MRLTIKNNKTEPKRILMAKPTARKKKLFMSFDPHTIEHLGIKMYSNLPNAIAELIANAYDADSKNVLIKLFDKKDDKRIEVIDME